MMHSRSVWPVAMILAGAAYVLALLCVVGPWLFDLHDNFALLVLILLLLVSPLVVLQALRNLRLLLSRRR